MGALVDVLAAMDEAARAIERESALYEGAERLVKARAAVAELIEDKARIDWLESQFKDGVHVEGCYSGSFSAANLKRCASVFVRHSPGEFEADSIRAAIDLARGAE